MKQPENIILASGSPRRQQLLKEAGINFFIKTKGTLENYPPDLKATLVPEFLADLKASAFLKELTNEVVIAADTVVILNESVLEKPAEYNEAFQMLSSLSGRKHEVVTGVCILSKNQKKVFSDLTEVYFKNLSEEEIDYYIKTFRPFDKAGGYGIQEWIGLIGVTKIIGSYFNVVGLPVHKVIDELKGFD